MDVRPTVGSSFCWCPHRGWRWVCVVGDRGHIIYRRGHINVATIASISALNVVSGHACDAEHIIF